MISPRRTAQIGLVFACLLLVSSLTVLVTGAATDHRPGNGQPGMQAPEFALSDASGHTYTLNSLHGKVVVIEFACQNCPIAADYGQRIDDMTRHYANDDRVAVLSILSVKPNAKAVAAADNASIPALLDVGSQVTNAYGADRTPTFFVIDQHGVIQYRGSFDDSRSPSQAHMPFCQMAVESVLHGDSVVIPAHDGPGCSVALAK